MFKGEAGEPYSRLMGDINGFYQKRVTGNSQIGPKHNDTLIPAAPRGAATVTKY